MVEKNITGKRKREDALQTPRKRAAVTLQLVTGSYERVLHGFTAHIQSPILSKSDHDSSNVEFEDTFLFVAHSSAIRALAVSPPSEGAPRQASKRILATGGTDERINLYQISASAPSARPESSRKLLVPTATTTDSKVGQSKNRELGSLLHHESAITSLHFPSRGKLLSASTDNTIAITRVKDWTVLSTIRAPVPKAYGRPSGDTSALGDTPAGVIDVAVHPSSKLCVSIGHGERCMRLWNLVTGKKAGVLNFDKDVLQLLGERKLGTGEGRGVVWDDDGEEFVVMFERGCVIYGLDCQIRAVVQLSRTKVCQARYLPVKSSGDANATATEDGDETNKPNASRVLVVSTDDGRVLFYNTSLQGAEATDITSNNVKDQNLATNGDAAKTSRESPAVLSPIAELIQPDASLERRSRVKDFALFELPEKDTTKDSAFLVVAATSTGSVRICLLRLTELHDARGGPDATSSSTAKSKSVEKDEATQVASAVGLVQVGTELGVYETGHRITCMTGFVMDQGLAVATEAAAEHAVEAGATKGDAVSTHEG